MSIRDEFEAWAITSAWLGIGDESQMHMDADGSGYNEIEVHTAWLAWQASRSTIEVDLEPYERSDEAAHYLHEDFVKDRIELHGLKVKK